MCIFLNLCIFVPEKTLNQKLTIMRNDNNNTDNSRLKEVIAIVNNKGGVGKSTTAVCLASALHRRNYHWRILVIDLDSQCNATDLLRNNGESEFQTTIYDALNTHQPLPVYPSKVKSGASGCGVFLCPGHKFMAQIDTALRMQRPAEKVLLRCFANDIRDYSDCNLPPDIAEAFDYVLIDCPPALGDITFNAMMVADSVIFPCEAERLSIDALSKSITAFSECKQNLKPELRFKGILLTKVDERNTVTREYIKYVREQYGDSVFQTVIRLTAKCKEAQGLDRDLYDYAPKCNTAIDYEALAKELTSNH